MDTSNTRWGIQASTPPVNPAEVETGESAVEVVVMWGESILHVEHVSPPRDVTLSEALGDGGDPLKVVVERDGQLLCVVPEGATGTVKVGDAVMSFAELRSQGKMTPFDELPGASLYPLPDGAAAQIDHDGLSVLVRPTYAGKTIAAQAPVAWRRYAWIGVSVGVHAFMLVMFYLLPPTTSALSLDNISARDRMVEYLDVAPETTPFEEPEQAADSGESGGDPGQAHEGESGLAGREEMPTRDRSSSIEGREETPVMAREDLRENMDQVATIGTLQTLMGSWNTLTSPYGAEQAIGNSEANHIGNVMGLLHGDSGGNGGLGMHGTGRGAGGIGQGTLGVGRLGTIGRCSGARCSGGDGTGYGDSVGSLHVRRDRVNVTATSTGAQVRGGLSREAIRRVVRRNLRQVRFCYEQGLQQNPSIEGRVIVQWTIDPTGRVQGSSVASSTLRDASVESCIAQAVRRWSFPQPDGGSMVGVNYPFLLQSSN